MDLPGIQAHQKKEQDIRTVLQRAQRNEKVLKNLKARLEHTNLATLYQEINGKEILEANYEDLKNFLLAVAQDPQYEQDLRNVCKQLNIPSPPLLERNEEIRQARQMQLGYDHWGRAARLLFYIIDYILTDNLLQEGLSLNSSRDSTHRHHDPLEMSMATGNPLR